MKKINNFINEYVNNLSNSILSTNMNSLNLVAEIILKSIKQNQKIFVCGNGGSAAIANHYVVDFLKFFRERTNYSPKMISLSDNVETITAISNDMDYKYIFSYQAQSLCNKNDLIIIISSSGNSKNVIELLKFSKKNKIKTIGFSGFNGGYLKKNADISVHIRADNYGISEDAHHILMHGLLQYLIKYFGKKKN